MASESEVSDAIQALDLNLQFADKGVMVINTDGTISKISNWNEMTEREQIMACKLISKRNEKRKAALEIEKAKELKEAAEADIAPGAGENGDILPIAEGPYTDGEEIADNDTRCN